MIGAKDERHRVDQVDAALRSHGLSGNSNGGLGCGCRLRGAGDGGGLRGFLGGGQEKILTSCGEPCHRPQLIEEGERVKGVATLWNVGRTTLYRALVV